MPNPMDDFNPEADRLRQVNQEATLARLRDAAPDTADRIKAAQAEPDPTRVHREILRKRFPKLPMLSRPWGRPGLPSLRDLGALAELAAHFSPKAILQRRQVERVFRTYFSSSPAQKRQIEIATLGHSLRPTRRSPWSRLAFWRR